MTFEFPRFSTVSLSSAMLFLACWGIVPTYVTAAPQRAAVNFNDDWRFTLGDLPGAEASAYDDSKWRELDVPHDWSIEDLPPRTRPAPEFVAVPGEWRFQQGDSDAWKTPDIDDSAWQTVVLPQTWEKHSSYAADNVYGWFRRRVELPTECKDRDFDLLLGSIDDVDEVWFNGTRIGGTGAFPPEFKTAYSADRRYRVSKELVRNSGDNVIAVRVFDGAGNGGMVRGGSKSVRIGPFDTLASAGGHFTGYSVGGTAWYRKRFSTDASGERVSVHFDGVYMNSEVWINGHRVGQHPHGYTSFEFELTPHLNPPGETNHLAVRVRNEGRNSRWYSGSGIYRPVWLVKTAPVHVPTWGLFVSTPEVTPERAQASLSVEICNTTSADTAALVVVARVHDAEGRLVNEARQSIDVKKGETRRVEERIVVPNPRFWSPETPHLYTAAVEIQVAGKSVDTVETRFGVRTIEFDAEHGFRLNGKAVELKGGCVHHDNGPLGAVAIDRAEERKIELLKANGFNAVRTSHNPPSSAFLEACDRLGMLVITEAFDQWTVSKEGNHQDYHRFFEEWNARDIAAMVRRDRNHPSIIMWSVGNEIPEQFQPGDKGQRLREAVLAHDTTRPVTQAICNDWGKVTRNWNELSDPAFTHLDVAGYNYLPERYEGDHDRHPGRVMYGAESYPKDAYLYWSLAEKHPYVIGDFVWTAMDYLGEAGLAHSLLSNEPDSFFMSWPWYNAWSGDLDVCGFKKPQSYYRDVLWDRSPIEMMVHEPIPADLTEVISGWGWPKEAQSWTWPGHDGKPLEVSVYSRCQRVRLELNGRTIGEKPTSAATQFAAKFSVPYEAGELRAIGLRGDTAVAETRLRTAGAPKALRLTVDRAELRASRADLSYVAVEVVDASGARVPNAELLVRFSVTGAGELAAQGSGTPNQPASFRIPERKTFQGRCLAIVRPVGAAGGITLRAEAEGLAAAETNLTTR